VAAARSEHLPAQTRRPHDAPERGGELQQPVQQRAPNRCESRRTQADDAERSPAQTAHRRTATNPSNVTGGQGVGVVMTSWQGMHWSGRASRRQLIRAAAGSSVLLRRRTGGYLSSPRHTATVSGAAMTDTRGRTPPPAATSGKANRKIPGSGRGWIITAADSGRLRRHRLRAGDGRSRRPEPGTA
jgi:hypothetical protein